MNLQPKPPHSFVIANQLVRDSYVSLHIVLSHSALIPEHVAVVTSVTMGCESMPRTQYSRFSYKYISPEFFFGFHYRQVSHTEWAHVATPEKALLDLIYLTADADSEGYIRALRLQNLDLVDHKRLVSYVERADQPKLKRALPHIQQVIEEELTEYEYL